jgi:16S rRNA (uracil1498-N3)-methyltransferase
MRIPRVFHGAPLAGLTRVELDLDAAHHLLMVLRLKPGEPVILFDGSGQEFDARVEVPQRNTAWVTIQGARSPVVESPLQVTLAQGISRGERMDYTVQKAVELGVAHIIPVFMERSVVKLDADKALARQEHWQAVATGACEQSGRVEVPQVDLPLKLDAFLAAKRDAGLKLLLDPLGGKTTNEIPKPSDNHVLLLVGPEGGLSEKEVALATHVGFTGLKLGPRILRTETAALVALSLLQSKWGDLG